jgi:hypothetical protein
MQAEPQKEHHWLQKLVGEWTFDPPLTKVQGILRGCYEAG